MTTYYVNKSGDDINGGLNHSDAFLTVQNAIDTASTSDTIVIGSGEYNESLSSGTGKTLTFESDGYVIFNGQGTIEKFITSVATGTNWTFSGEYWQIKGYYGYIYFHVGFGEPVIIFSFTNTHIFGPQTAFYNANPTGGTARMTITLDKCICSDIGTVFQNRYNTNPTYRMNCYVSNTLFYNCTNIYYLLQSYENISSIISRDRGNIYYDCDTIYYTSATLNNFIVGSGTTHVDNYYYNYSTPLMSLGGAVTYDTLSDVQTATSKYGGDSDEADPELADPSNGFFAPKDTSVIVGKGQTVDYIGPFNRMISFSNNYQSYKNWAIGSISSSFGDDWAIISGGAEIAANGNMIGTGVIVSPVYDLYAKYQITRIHAALKEVYPTSVIDADIDDVEPNRKNIEYRISDSPFYQNSATPSWTKSELEKVISISGRYVQFRLTFRVDGVAS